MVDFQSLCKNPPKEDQYKTCIGIRFDHEYLGAGDYTWKEGREVEIKYDIKKAYDDRYWLYLLNGPTGYESMPFETIPGAVERKVPWAANFGSHVYWKLDIPWYELEKIWKDNPEFQHG